MLREIETFETADGARFDDADKAREHIADAVRALLDARLAGLQADGKVSANDRFKIVMAIIPDADAAHVLHMQLARWMNY